MPTDMTAAIRVRPEIRDQLKKRGVKGETYNDIITRLLDAPETVI